MTIVSRRIFVAASAAIALAPSGIARASAGTLRVGYQKYGSLLLLKTSGFLEKHLTPLGWDVEWRQFISGPPLMEALAAGAIDVGTAGETPPIFAQAAGAPLVYLAAEPAAPHGEAVLVKADSPIKSLADLKGKKIAFNKGSNVHYLFVKALERAKLTPSDVTPVYLAPADGRAAFERDSVDAWVIWDPFYAAAQSTGHTRIIADGVGLVANHQFYLGNRHFAQRPVLDAFRAAIAEVDRLSTTQPDKAAHELSPAVGLPEDVVAVAVKRQSWNVKPIDAELVASQQAIADIFYKLKLIPKEIRISDAVTNA